MHVSNRVGFVLLALGILAMVGALAWGALFVGVPYPDPTPEQKIEEAFHLQVTTAGFLLGAALLVGSIAIFLLRAVWRLVLGRRSDPPIAGASERDESR